MLSNCWIWAELEYWRRRRAWVRAGMPAGGEPYRVSRPSRHEPRRLIDHHLVGRWSDSRQAVVVESFKPVAPRPVPWWMAWTRLLFRGSVQQGDQP